MNFKKLLQIISGKKYRKCPDKTAIDMKTQRAFNAGLINSEQIMAYCDSYTTGLSHSNLAEGLGSYWGINSPEEATETLESLRRYGHRFFYNIIYQVYIGRASGEENNEIFEALLASGRYGLPEILREQITAKGTCQENALFFADLEKAIEMMGNLRSVFRLLNDKVNGSYLPEDYNAGILAWDLGRLITVARMSLDSKFIGRDEFSQILEHVNNELRTNFSSWPQFAKSYIIGRACWAGQNMMLDGITGIAEDLMMDKNSPWVLSPL